RDRRGRTQYQAVALRSVVLPLPHLAKPPATLLLRYADIDEAESHVDSSPRGQGLSPSREGLARPGKWLLVSSVKMRGGRAQNFKRPLLQDRGGVRISPNGLKFRLRPRGIGPSP